MLLQGSLFEQNQSKPPECAIILDSGFSFTHSIPIMNGAVIWEAVRRFGTDGLSEICNT